MSCVQQIQSSYRVRFAKMNPQSLLYNENQALKKQLHALKCELGLNKQNADLLAEQNGREKGGLRKKLVILTAVFTQQSKQLQELSQNAQTRALKNASLRRSHNNNNNSVASCRKFESFVAGDSFRSTRDNNIAKKDSPFLCQDVRLKDSTVKINRKTECVPANTTNNNNNGTSSKLHLKSPSDKSKITKSLSTVPRFNSQDIRCQNKSLNINRKIELPTTTTSTRNGFNKNASPSPTNIVPKKSFPSKANVITCQDVRLQNKSLKVNRYVDTITSSTTTTNVKPPSYDEVAVNLYDNKVAASAHSSAHTIESNIITDNKEFINESANNNKYYDDFTADWSDVLDEKIDFKIILDFGDEDE